MDQGPAERVTEQEAMKLAEDSREREWVAPSFLRELFLGNFRFDLVHPFPGVGEAPRAEFVAFYQGMESFLHEHVDPVRIDTEGDYPGELIDGLRRLGAFGMKIPKEYGGLGLTQTEYNRIMELVGSHDANVSALLSAHQSIGVPQPIKLFGTPEQKQRLLPRCAAGALSAFALTEPDVGSDPARLAATAQLTPEGDAYILNGEKLWCTNGTLAELIVVMARHPGTKRISAFVVEMDREGIEVAHRCRFMGLRALSNALIRLRDVRVPRENLIGAEGAGLKIALVTLNTGRLALPAACAGVAKACMRVVRHWSNQRVQWGHPIGKHEAIAHYLADIVATGYAMSAVADLAAQMADRGGYDIRLEAAAAKLWNTEMAWKLIDSTLQVRGGRGYETESSLAGRGEPAIGVERMLRDARINRIFEGSSEILHLFMAREAVDRHLQVAGGLIDPARPLGSKLGALPGIAGFYAKWYPTRWAGWRRWPDYREYGRLGRHLRFLERSGSKLAREIFHGMLVHRARLQRKQGFLFRTVDVANEVFAMAAAVSRAATLAARGDPDASRAAELADLFCRGSRRRVRQLFRDLWRNDDALRYRIGQHVLEGRHAWLEHGASHLPLSADAVEALGAAAEAEVRQPLAV